MFFRLVSGYQAVERCRFNLSACLRKVFDQRSWIAKDVLLCCELVELSDCLSSIMLYELLCDCFLIFIDASKLKLWEDKICPSYISKIGHEI